MTYYNECPCVYQPVSIIKLWTVMFNLNSHSLTPPRDLKANPRHNVMYSIELHYL